MRTASVEAGTYGLLTRRWVRGGCLLVGSYRSICCGVSSCLGMLHRWLEYVNILLYQELGAGQAHGARLPWNFQLIRLVTPPDM
jgi:hypothetical protein